MKECTTCNISKPLVEFSKNKSNKDGLEYKCKDCVKQYSKQYNQDNKESISKVIRELSMSEGYGVYTLTHLPTQCYYVGEGQIHNRRINHFSKLKRGVNNYGSLQEHFNKHPNIEDWEFQVIRKWDEINKDEGIKVEAKLIKWGLENIPKKLLNIKE